VEALRCCFERLDGKKAIGVDQVSKEEYGRNLRTNLEDLVERMKRMAYRPQPVKEVLIPKDGKPGATRPLGISTFEDKLVQKRMQELLESIYEPLFWECSYGFRPKRGCHDAIKALRAYLDKEEVETVIDVDLANFFGSIDHQMMLDTLRMKIKDKKFLRYVSRLLKAGILSQGELRMNEEGTVQGSCTSPVLANIVAHYVIDTWLEETVTPLMNGPVRAFRYADDLVICFRFKKDANRVKEVLGKRLEKYKLKLNEDKTKMVSFSKRAMQQGIKQESFNFLGFTFYLGRSKRGVVIPKLKTEGKRFRSKLKKVNEWAKKVRNKAPLKVIWKAFCMKLRGHLQYYGVSFNSTHVSSFLYRAVRIMFKWLNRRSQRKSFNWETFELFLKRYPVPSVKVYHRLF
jgi:group II intron reverse transcriptase/maturase